MKIRTITLIAALSAIAAPALGAGHQGDPKLDGVLRQHAHTPQGTSRVIIQTHDGSPLDGAGSEGLTRRQTYTVTEVRGKRRTPLAAKRRSSSARTASR